MSPIRSSLLLGAGDAAAGGFQVSRSLRFEAGDSSNLSRTPSVASNRKTWSLSVWIKGPFNAASYPRIINVEGPSAGYRTTARFTDTSQLQVYSYDGSNFQWLLTTTQVFRDPSAWYHLLLAFDTTQATSSNRVKLYVNGVQVTTFSSATYPSSDFEAAVNHTSPHTIGGGQPLSAYLANVQLIDGQQLTPSSFTEVSATTGQLIPKAYTGTYGTNGFYLKFADNSTTAALGTDSSGNGNTWTTNNFSVTAGAGNDSMVDTPTSISATDTGVGNEVRGNYATLNPLDRMTDNPSNGNLEWTVASANHRGIRSTIKFPSSGKWYYEATVGTASGSMAIGVGMATPSATPGYSNTGTWFIVTNSSITAVIRETSNSTISGMSAPQVGDILQVAYDADAGKVWFGKNNVWANGTTGIDGNPTTGANPTVSGFTADHFPCVTAYQATINCNFGQRAFAYTAPSGFKALVDTNLPTPVVAKSNTVFDVVTYTGTGAALTPTSALGFNPDWIWIKSRSAATDHALYDVVRGAQARLESNTTDAEVTTDGGVTAFNSAGFTLGTLAQVNTSAATYAAWCWDAGTSTVSNTAGSITSQVRANATAGFSVVTYTGNGSSGATVGHGLNVAPQLLILKRRSSAGSTANWAVWHGSLTAGQNLFLNTTDSASAYSPSRFTSTLPTSTVFSIGGGDETNYSTGTFVCYAFAPVVGYSSFGTYVGTGSGEGSFVYTGFKPKWVMCKRSDSTGNWVLVDGVRTPYNVINTNLYPNASNAEDNSFQIDSLSNGFKVRSSGTDGNASGGTYVFAAFAESPFQYARAR